MEYKLELVLAPVTDLDRARSFYLEQAGLALLIDTPVGEEMRVVQPGRIRCRGPVWR